MHHETALCMRVCVFELVFLMTCAHMSACIDNWLLLQRGDDDFMAHIATAKSISHRAGGP